MTNYINGSLAYDRIMHFQGRFSEQILAEHLDNINVSFTMDSMQEFFGGTAGNIAYGLSVLGDAPVLAGNLGKDGDRYLEYLNVLGVDISNVGIMQNEFSPGAYITTDLDGNQITAFNAGAMKYPCQWRARDIDPAGSRVIISPGNVQDMAELPPILRQRNVPFIFDPGQSLPAWQGPDLANALHGAFLLITNQYELNLLCNLINADLPKLHEQVENVVVTDGFKGSTLYSQGGTWQIGLGIATTVVDPTGAGDAYRAGIMAALAQGSSLVEACRTGSALAALSVGVKGTQGYRLPKEGLNVEAVSVTLIK